MEYFKELCHIGSGVFGEVFKAVSKVTGERVALKVVPMGKNGVRPSTVREITILKLLRHHPNIVRFEDVLTENKRVILIFELLSMDLYQYMSSLPPEDYLDSELVKSYLYQIARAVSFCHRKGVIHRDLKPENLLIDPNGIIKLADFGLSRFFDTPECVYRRQMVALGYRAPEILLHSPRYSCPIDIWSIGCIFAEMDIGKPLFPGECQIDQIFRIFRVLKTPTEEIWPGVTSFPVYNSRFPRWTVNLLPTHVRISNADGLDLMQKMLTYDPERRISAKDILKHPYFDGFDGKPAQ